jgi:hypothetical protein
MVVVGEPIASSSFRIYVCVCVCVCVYVIMGKLVSI